MRKRGIGPSITGPRAELRLKEEREGRALYVLLTARFTAPRPLTPSKLKREVDPSPVHSGTRSVINSSCTSKVRRGDSRRELPPPHVGSQLCLFGDSRLCGNEETKKNDVLIWLKYLRRLDGGKRAEATAARELSREDKQQTGKLTVYESRVDSCGSVPQAFLRKFGPRRENRRDKTGETSGNRVVRPCSWELSL